MTTRLTAIFVRVSELLAGILSVVAVVVGVVFVPIDVLPSASASQETSQHLVGYEHAALDVPTDWNVRLGTFCHHTVRTIFIAPPPGTSACQADPTAPEILLQALPSTPSSLLQGKTRSRVNGATVYASSSSTVVTWVVPSMGVKISGWGVGVSTIVHSLVRTKALAYGTAAVSVPSNWKVRTHTTCAHYRAAVVYLTWPHSRYCPSGQGADDVYISGLPHGYTPSGFAPRRVNDVQVLEMSRAARLTWIVPSLWVGMTGLGKGASAVMHTLHRLGT